MSPVNVSLLVVLLNVIPASPPNAHQSLNCTCVSSHQGEPPVISLSNAIVPLWSGIVYVLSIVSEEKSSEPKCGSPSSKAQKSYLAFVLSDIITPASHKYIVLCSLPLPIYNCPVSPVPVSNHAIIDRLHQAVLPVVASLPLMFPKAFSNHKVRVFVVLFRVK